MSNNQSRIIFRWCVLYWQEWCSCVWLIHEISYHKTSAAIFLWRRRNSERLTIAVLLLGFWSNTNISDGNSSLYDTSRLIYRVLLRVSRIWTLYKGTCNTTESLLEKNRTWFWDKVGSWTRRCWTHKSWWGWWWWISAWPLAQTRLQVMDKRQCKWAKCSRRSLWGFN